MCKFASFVLTREHEFWIPGQDSHEGLIAHYGLGHLDGDRIGLVRVEITPSDTPLDLTTWRYRVDQDTYPAWTYAGDPDLESRARAALLRRAAEEHICELVTHPTLAVSGYYGTATAGDYGTATAGYGGVICVRYWDNASKRARLTVGYVGEDGIEPGVPYRCDRIGLVRC